MKRADEHHTARGPAAPANRRQLERFRALRDAFPGARASFANSAGTLLGPEYHFDLVRPGIALYGHDPHYLHTAPRVRPVATFEARLGQIATVEPGESVGYGGAATCDVARRVGVVLAGCADGIPRPLYWPDRQFEVMVAGYRAPLFGTVSMDMITIDLSGVPEGAVEGGAWVEIFGTNALIERVAEQTGTIPYEVLAGIGPRVQCIHVGARRVFRDSLAGHSSGISSVRLPSDGIRSHQHDSERVARGSVDEQSEAASA